ncbi:MAG TPA: HTTM domain-containing protein [Candidatus Limnocylindrales bacterium]|nr:HTTM domain-containing protein [Candidatus Limnocylindrales bacterium]
MIRDIRSARERLFTPVDIAPLVFLRIVFGSVMLWEVVRYFQHGWIERYYSPADFHLRYYGFEWVTPWPGHGMQWHFVALGIAAACIAAGFLYRIAAAVFFAGFTYVFLLDEAHYLNHFYLVCLLSFLLIFVPAERSCSVDAWLGRVRRSDFAPAWALWVIRAQIGLPYLFGGIAKLNGDWIRGEPIRMWLAERSDYFLIGPYVHEEWFVYFFVIGGLLLDLLLVPSLLWRRTRVPAFLAAMSFHLMNAWLFRIGIFPWLMLAASLVFFPPEVSRRILNFLRFPIDGRASEGDVFTPPRKQVLVAALLAVYLGIQVLMPLRHFLYPGNVNWTEEGHRFSWHMKLRDKEGNAVFHVVDRATGKKWTVNPSSHLDPWQASMVPKHPDMILQYAHELAEKSRRKGIADVEVHADVLVSLNGRKRQRLIDPAADLAKVERSLHHADWILPLTEPLPPPGRKRKIMDNQAHGPARDARTGADTSGQEISSAESSR